METLSLRRARIDITPGRDAPLVFPRSSGGPPDLPRERLWARALLLEDAVGGRALVLSVDCLWISDEMRAAVVAAGAERGLSPAQILVAATHTHSGPQTLREPNAMGGEPDPVYLDLLDQQLKALVDTTCRSVPVAVRAVLTRGRLPGVVQRNRMRWILRRSGRLEKRLQMLPDPSGPVDDEVRVLRFEREDERVVALLLGAACHPTVLRGPVLSRDYPGVAADYIQDATGAESLFLLGFGGDLRPDFRTPARTQLCSLRGIVSFLRNRALPFRYARYHEMVAFGRRLGRVVTQLVKEPGLSVGGPIDCRLLEGPLPLEGGRAAPLVVQTLGLGPRLRLLGINAEVFHELREPVSAIRPDAILWPVGLANGVLGYLHPARLAPYRPYGAGLVLRQSVGRLAPDHEAAVLRLVSAALGAEQSG